MRPAIPLYCAVLMLLSGCGGGDRPGREPSSGAPVLGRPAEAEEAAQELGFPAFATKNTTRVGGSDAIVNAAGVALAVYPGAGPDSRPQVVTIVDVGDWRSAISAGQLMSRPLRAPVLLSRDGRLPAAVQDALAQLRPRGAEKAGKAQVLRIGNAAAKPEGLKSTDVPGVDPALIAAAIDRLAASAAGAPSRSVIVAPSGRPAYAMPAAGLAAKTGAPVLWTDRNRVPAATVSAIESRKKPRIYVLGPAEGVSAKVVRRLGRLGTVKRVHGADPVANAIAVARFADGRFGWNVVDPGHGMVFASSERTADAAAAAALAGSGTYGPLLLVSDAGSLPRTVESYLLDIQPGYDRDPVRGVYNHAWLMGDENAISVAVQARIDSLLEIQPVDR